ncbi:MAG: hypothetical protein A4E19_06470 [Nitrospira sp. SG-bin1]|nr:MAG: hypothetical protein A4E19_06470 [Nitrospira sp. SG-bin1]
MPLNESALSLAWLLRALTQGESTGPSHQSPGFGQRSTEGADTPQHRWHALSTAMREHQNALPDKDAELDSDIWLCKSQTVTDGILRAIWRPPDNLDDFAPGPLGQATSAGWDVRPTQSARLDALIADQPSFPDEMLLVRCNKAVASYMRLYEATTPPLVQPELKSLIIMINQILAWLNIAIGAYLRGIVLTPFRTPQDLETLTSMAELRIAAVAGSGDDDPFLQTSLVGMYNTTRFQPDQPSSTGPTHSGQGEVWRERWGWLTQDAAPEDARTAIIIAAQLLANVAIVSPLIKTAGTASQRDSTAALCYLRRLLLTLRAMAWAEEALQVEWRLVRPADLLCFAYSALRPNWPRRMIALSHRSSTVKPRLFSTPFWDSPFAALDATYAPQWETNIGMIWGLFAPTPTIVRMPSPPYRESEWCQRESELLDYLVNRCDFMRNRRLIDASESDATNLSSLLNEPRHEPGSWPRPVRLLHFPLLSAAEAALMSAAGAVRLISVAAAGRTNVVAQVIRTLWQGSHPDLPCLTNNVGGWRDYVDIFRALPSSTAQAIDDGRLIIDDHWDFADRLRFLELAKNLPDFGDPRVPALRDHLAAFEWMLVEEEALLRDYAYANLVVDCRHVSREHWERSAAYTIGRGLTSTATRVPVWFLQSANERVDQWTMVGDYRPIFTEHFEGQFSWMNIVSLPEGWFERYSERNGLRW